MKNKSLSYRLFYNDKVLIVLALLAATIIWLYIAVEKNVLTTLTFYDLNVTAEGATSIEEKYGLQCYGLDNVEPSVIVQGQRYVVGSESFKDNVIVSVDVSKIYDVGEYTLPVEAEISNGDSSTSVVSVSPDYVSLFFDKPTTKTFDIEVEVDSDDITQDGYVHGEAYAEPGKVTFEGPSSEIKKIDSVVARVSVDSPLSETATYNTEYEIITTDGSTLTYSNADVSSDVEVRLPVYKTKEFGVQASFDGAPESFSDYVTVTVSPSTVYGGVISSVSDDVENFSVPVDYSKIEPGENVITVPVADVEAANGCVIVDEIEEFTITVTTTDLAQKTVAADTIEVTGGNYESVDANTSSVTIMGPASAVSAYDAENVTLYADISSVDIQRGSVVIPLTLEDGSECWLINSPTATVKIN